MALNSWGSMAARAGSRLWAHSELQGCSVSALWGTVAMSSAASPFLPEFSGPLPSSLHLPDAARGVPGRDPLVLDHEVLYQRMFFYLHFLFLEAAQSSGHMEELNLPTDPSGFGRPGGWLSPGTGLCSTPLHSSPATPRITPTHLLLSPVPGTPYIHWCEEGGIAIATLSAPICSEAMSPRCCAAGTLAWLTEGGGGRYRARKPRRITVHSTASPGSARDHG